MSLRRVSLRGTCPLFPASGMQAKQGQVLSASQYPQRQDVHLWSGSQYPLIPRAVTGRTLAECLHPASIYHLFFLILWWLKSKDLRKGEGKGHRGFEGPGKFQHFFCCFCEAGTKIFMGERHRPLPPGRGMSYITCR